MKQWNLQVEEEAWGISAFKAILKRDKSKEKETAMKEMMFVYFFSDIKSDFLIVPEEQREEAIKGEINLPEKWEMDDVIKEAVSTYKKYSQTTIQKLYQQSLKAAHDVGNYLERTDELLEERDGNGKVVTDIGKITGALQKVPAIMILLKNAYKEVIKEQEDMEGKKKGSRTMNIFEDGIKID